MTLSLARKSYPAARKSYPAARKSSPEARKLSPAQAAASLAQVAPPFPPEIVRQTPTNPPFDPRAFAAAAAPSLPMPREPSRKIPASFARRFSEARLRLFLSPSLAPIPSHRTAIVAGDHASRAAHIAPARGAKCRPIPETSSLVIAAPQTAQTWHAPPPPARSACESSAAANAQAALWDARKDSALTSRQARNPRARTRPIRDV